MLNFFKKEIQPLVDNIDDLMEVKKIKVIHLKDIIINEENVDFGGQELLSGAFNRFLEKRYNYAI